MNEEEKRLKNQRRRVQRALISLRNLSVHMDTAEISEAIGLIAKLRDRLDCKIECIIQ